MFDFEQVKIEFSMGTETGAEELQLGNSYG